MIKQDQIILNQAIQRHREQEVRQKREIPIPRSFGAMSVGSIYDCNRKHFERALKAYWDKLYIGWNPLKNDGMGCWEVWQRPLRKTPVLRYFDQTTGVKIYTAEYKPNDYEHWVADLPFLTYDFIGKLRKMDSWDNKYQVSEHDDEHERHLERIENLEEENIKYVVKHNKQAFRDLLDYTQEGFNPLQFFNKK